MVPRTLEDSDVFVGFLCLYLLTASRSPPLGDALPIWQATENFVRHGSFAISAPWPVNAPPGPSGAYFPVAALLALISHAPGALLQWGLGAWVPDRAPQFVAITAQLGPLIMGALVPVLFFRLLRQLGYGGRAAAWTTLLLGLGTPIWVYAHRPYSEALQALCFLAFFSSLLAAAAAPTRGRFLSLGLAVGLLVNAKNVYFVCLPGAFAFLFWRLRHRVDALRRLVGWSALGLAPGAFALAWYNRVRWGSLSSSGYGSVTEGFWTENIVVGLWGQFLSPGKSIFLYAPPLLLSLWGARGFWRRHPAVVGALMLVVAPVILVYARYLFWSGDWGWGPRYLVFAVPLLLLPAAELFERDEPDGVAAVPFLTRPAVIKRLTAGAVALVLAAGIVVQVLGNAFYWDDFINISRQAQQGWLGRPDARGTVLAPYPCFSCFEEVYPVQWLPPMQPIAGHAWLLRHKLAGADWEAAGKDAPWRRYTSLPLDIRTSYEAAGIDWWPFGAEPGGRFPVIAVALLLLAAIPYRPWVRALRAHRARPPQA